jgi:hopanoid biosynthesis associated RND transporter like protein HpnN
MDSREVSPQKSTFFDQIVYGVLKKFADWSCASPILSIVVSVLFAFGSLWITQNLLKFKTGRDDLVSQDLQYNRLYKDYRKAFADYDGMITVIEGPTPEAMAGFAEAFASQLKKQPSLFSNIFFKVDIEYFKKKGLLYLDEPNLDNLISNVLDRQDFLEELNEAPGLNNLLTIINRQISSGMVDTMLLGLIEDEEEPKKSDKDDLSFLTKVLKQIATHIKNEERYKSPWNFLPNEENETLKKEGYLTSDDGSMLFLLINPNETKGDFAGAKRSIDAIRSIISELTPRFKGVRVGLTGAEVVAADEMAATLKDVTIASQIALAGVSILFIIAFKSVIKPLIAVFCLLLALCWTLGYASITVGSLNILSVVFTTILIGLGIDFGIHLLERYREERAREENVDLAIRRTIIGTGKANLSGAVTTTIAFASLTVGDFKGIAELGIISAGGVLLSFLAMTITLPSAIVLEERWRKKNLQPTNKTKAQTGYAEAFYSHYLKIIFACFVLLGISSWPLKDLEFDYNILHLQAKNTEAVTYELKMVETGNRSTWYAVSLASSLKETQQRSKAFENLSTVEKVESVVSSIPKNQKQKITQIKELEPFTSTIEIESKNEPVSIKGLEKIVKRILFKLRTRENSDAPLLEDVSDPIVQSKKWAQEILRSLSEIEENLSKARLSNFSDKLFLDYRNKMGNLQQNVNSGPVALKELPENFKRRFLGANGKFLIIIYPKIDIWKKKEMESFLKELRSIDSGITGNGVHLYQSGQKMKEGYIQGGKIALFSIFIYLLLSLKRLWTAVLVLIPTIAGSIWTVGIMSIVGIQFNLANLVILPLILGIGVVDGVHLVHRFREETDKTVCLLTRSVGQAIVLTTLTTMIGFGSLTVADHQGIHSLGLLLTIGVANCLLASVTLLPALLRWSAEKRITI